MSDQISKASKTDQKKEPAKSSVQTEKSPVKLATACDSPTSSNLSDDGFHGFDNETDNSQKQNKNQNALLRVLERLNSSGNASTSEQQTPGGEAEKVSEAAEEEQMTVDAGRVSDTDSDHMEIDMGNDKDTSASVTSPLISDKRSSKNKDSDVDIMEVDSVISDDANATRKEQTNDTSAREGVTANTPSVGVKGAKVEYCGGCSTEVDDMEEGICCDGHCERWFHLRCSGLSQAEYDELGHDENAKWACNKCSGKPPPVIGDASKPLLAVRKDLTKLPSTPTPTKRKSVNKEGRTPKIDISNPAFLKPFDFGWKRELVYRSTNDNQNRRQGDVYYYTPKGKKLRSLREIADSLAGTDLTQDNFTFWKEPILGVDDPEKEIIRDAKFKLVHKDPNASPAPPKKTTPKITKTPKTMPKLTATVTPLEASPAVKASASITPRIVFKGGKTGLGSGAKFKVAATKSTPPGPTQKIAIPKGAETTGKRHTNNVYSTSKNFLSIITDSRAATSVVEIEKEPEPLKDIDKSTRKKFKRYGLLANAKTRRQASAKGSSLSSSSEDLTDFSPETNLQRVESHAIRKHSLGQRTSGKSLSRKRKSKVTSCSLAEEDTPRHKKQKTCSTAVQPFSNSPVKVSPSNSLEMSLLASPSNRRPTPPDFQFRPSNPSSYGCQTSSLGPHRSLSPNISGPSPYYRSSFINCTSPFETVLIVDTSPPESSVSASKPRSSPYDPPSSDYYCPIEIANVESLEVADPTTKYGESYFIDTPYNQLSIGTRKKNSIVEAHSGLSPVSSRSSSPDVVVIDEDQDQDGSTSPPFLIRNSPSPKLVKTSTPNQSPPSLRPVLSPVPADPCSATRTYPRQLNANPETSHRRMNENYETLYTQNSDTRNSEYRKIKRERVRLRVKAKKEMEKRKRAHLKKKELFFKRKSEEKRLRIQYLQLKVKLKELKMGLVKEKLAKV